MKLILRRQVFNVLFIQCIREHRYRLVTRSLNSTTREKKML